MHGHKMSLLSQLQTEVNPALCFHLCVAVMFQVSGQFDFGYLLADEVCFSR